MLPLRFPFNCVLGGNEVLPNVISRGWYEEIFCIMARDSSSHIDVDDGPGTYDVRLRYPRPSLIF